MPYPDAGSACPILGCPNGRRPDNLMCSTHWHKVPAGLQARIYAAWRKLYLVQIWSSYEKNPTVDNLTVVQIWTIDLLDGSHPHLSLKTISDLSRKGFFRQAIPNETEEDAHATS